MVLLTSLVPPVQMRQKIDSLKEEQQALSNALPLYPPVSTPGSTPGSSVVNINDVGQLSAELHVPHLGEQDAISARATVSAVSRALLPGSPPQ